MVEGCNTDGPPIPQSVNNNDAGGGKPPGGRSARRRLRRAPAGRGALGGRRVQPAVRRAARLDDAVPYVLGPNH